MYDSKVDIHLIVCFKHANSLSSYSFSKANVTHFGYGGWWLLANWLTEESGCVQVSKKIKLPTACVVCWYIHYSLKICPIIIEKSHKQVHEQRIGRVTFGNSRQIRLFATSLLIQDMPVLLQVIWFDRLCRKLYMIHNIWLYDLK